MNRDRVDAVTSNNPLLGSGVTLDSAYNQRGLRTQLAVTSTIMNLGFINDDQYDNRNMMTYVHQSGIGVVNKSVTSRIVLPRCRSLFQGGRCYLARPDQAQFGNLLFCSA